MRTARTIVELREALADVDDVGLVPTMGALHAGHEALVRRARAECAAVVVSVFVNPAQFGRGEDFERYPRGLERDGRLAETWGADLVFAPSVDEMYPDGYDTWVEVAELSADLEGAARPGHFRGVATVCLKLFNLVRPRRAYFGQKDAQQAAVVERMVQDLDLEVEVRLVPTVRDEDGVAVSSRNAYLSAAEREAARALPHALEAGARAHGEGRDPARAARSLLAREPRLDPEYVEVARLDGRVYLLAAVRAGGTRLIDNVVLEGVVE
ncbi:MAG TPA: pantoate--beta-alanine ligase [Gaiellaceae bacterium]|nr:pantoate--beta-alanine ligase [Gaiellaceae bacterium]